jgi:predicted metal-binding membrane protein
MASAFGWPRIGRDQAVTLAGLIGVTVLAWAYLFHDASQMASMNMDGIGPGGMKALQGGNPFDLAELTLLFLMWSIMMVGMMVPSAAPAILMYATIAKKHQERGSAIPPAWLFALGYLGVWIAFSALATGLQVGMREAALLTPMMVSKSSWLTGPLLILAGIWQWLPIKDACLQKCRAPLQFFMFHWQPGNSGAFRMGMEHGGFCLGCCWAIMLLLFVAGVMNLIWVAVIAAFVFMEKLAPGGAWVGRISGLVMLALGGGILVGAIDL